MRTAPGMLLLRFLGCRHTPIGLPDLPLIEMPPPRWIAGGSGVIAIGYSRGAGVLPFMISRLPMRERDEVKLLGANESDSLCREVPQMRGFAARDRLSVVPARQPSTENRQRMC